MGVKEAVVAALETFRSIGVEPIVGGSFASGAWGQPRQTNDIDLSAELDASHETAVLAAFSPRFTVGPAELRWALHSGEPGRMFSMMFIEDPFKIDVFVTDKTPYERSEIGRARLISLMEGIEAKVLAPENIVLRKLLWYDEGNRVSDRQWNDLMQILDVQGASIDQEYLLNWAKELEVEDLAREALSCVKR